MREYIQECQKPRAAQIGRYPEFIPLNVGDVVRVRATKKERKDKLAIGWNTARAVIHKQSVRNPDFFHVRWLSQGLSTGKGGSRDPGGIPNHTFMRSFLTPVAKEPPKIVFRSELGTMMIVEEFQNGDCNYVYIDGKYEGNLYLTDPNEFKKLESISYAEYVEECDERKNEKPDSLKLTLASPEKVFPYVSKE